MCKEDSTSTKISLSEDNYKICMDIKDKYNAHNAQFKNYFNLGTGIEFPHPLIFFQTQMIEHNKLINDMDCLFTELNSSINKILENKSDSSIYMAPILATPIILQEIVSTEMSHQGDVEEILLPVECENLPIIAIENSNSMLVLNEVIVLKENKPSMLKFKTHRILKRIRTIEEQPMNPDSNISTRGITIKASLGNKSKFYIYKFFRFIQAHYPKKEKD